MLHAPHEMGLDERVDLVKRADAAARAYDPRVFQVQATYADSLRDVLVATSEGTPQFRSPADGAHERRGAGARSRTALRSTATPAAADASRSISS